ncbi:ribonuclease H-like domain, reverse transcriptase, RNA-dependent DNA polymerase [Tanacetum coccineum]
MDNLLVQQKEDYANSTNKLSTISPSASAVGQSFDNADDLSTDPLMPDLEDTANFLNTGIFSGAYDDEDKSVEADFNNLETTMNVSPIPTTRIHKDHSKDQIIGDINSATQTRRMTGNGYSRKGQNQSQKRQNRARERKEREAKVKSKPKSQSQIKSKSTPGSGFGKSIENRTRKRKLPKVGPPVPTMVCLGWVYVWVSVVRGCRGCSDSFPAERKIKNTYRRLLHRTMLGRLCCREQKLNSYCRNQDNIVDCQAQKEKELNKGHPNTLCTTDPLISNGPRDCEGDAGNEGYRIDLPRDKWAIGTKWVFKNKKDERGIVVKNKARLVAQGHTQEDGIDYDEVFGPVARIEAIRLFLAYSSFKDFVVYQMDVKSAFLYGKIEEEVKQKSDGIFISQDRYVAEILKKFDFALVKTASTPIETNKALVKDEEAEDVDVHLFQVTPKTSHFNAVKKIFRYLKGQPKLGLWYPRDSPFDLESFSDSDYAGASLDRKSTTGGCQFLGKRLISWQCKKQTIVANSTTKSKYVAAANCCGHVGDEAAYKELGDIMERAATTASSSEAEQDSGSGPRCQDTILRDVDAQTWFETTSKQSNDPPLSKVNIFGNREDSMQLMEKMTHYKTVCIGELKRIQRFVI